MTSHMQAVSSIFQSTIYLMGISFILGSLFTIFVLLVLDYMQQRKPKKPAELELSLTQSLQ